jgi:hypothetical protein
LYQLAAEQNVQIRRLNHKRDSLEDIFLKAMAISAPPPPPGFGINTTMEAPGGRL